VNGPALTPLWWDAAPRDLVSDPLPRAVDVAVVRSGYTGLSVALRLAEGGANVAVIDAWPLAAGASSRNFGLLGRQPIPGFATLAKRLGLELATWLYRVRNAAFAHVNGLIDHLGIVCDRRAAGRLILCATPRHLDEQRHEHALRAAHLGHSHQVLDKAALRAELGSTAFHGGIAVPEHLTLHPGKFSTSLVLAVSQAGASLTGDTEVTAIDGQRGAFRLTCGWATVRAGEVVLATNGCTTGLVPDLRRRIVSSRALMLATKPLLPEVIVQALPRGRTFHDTAHDMIYGRPSPRGTRLMFGGLTGEAHRSGPCRRGSARQAARAVRASADGPWTVACLDRTVRRHLRSPAPSQPKRRAALCHGLQLWRGHAAWRLSGRQPWPDDPGRAGQPAF
jgi:glycine/D-amino acid oxidase-like deaminating enzyme